MLSIPSSDRPALDSTVSAAFTLQATLTGFRPSQSDYTHPHRTYCDTMSWDTLLPQDPPVRGVLPFRRPYDDTLRSPSSELRQLELDDEDEKEIRYDDYERKERSDVELKQNSWD